MLSRIRLLLTVFSFGVSPALAIGTLGFESSSFLRTSNDRGVSSTTAHIGFDYQGQSRVLLWNIDLAAYLFLNDLNSLTPEAENLYLESAPNLLREHKLTFGRKHIEWSRWDEQWKLGMWSPRFTWDPMDPKLVGLSGLFYQFNGDGLTLTALASPVSIPERGYPLRETDGKVTAGSPFFSPLPSKLGLGRSTLDINYQLNVPPYDQLLLQPGGSIGARFGYDKGFWGGGSYGYLPMNQLDLAVEPFVSPSNSTGKLSATARIQPRRLYHHLATLETGYRSLKWDLWASGTYEIPMDTATPPGWISNPLGPSIIGATGAQYSIAPEIRVLGSFMSVQEDKPTPVGGLSLPLPDRYFYRTAAKLTGEWDISAKWTQAISSTADLEFNTALLGAYATLRPWRHKASDLRSLTLTAGAEFIFAPERKGSLGALQGDDRIKGGMSYVF